MSVSWFRYRHGANPPGVNVGGDMGRGWKKGDSKEARFLDGIVEKVQTTGVDVTYEPLWQLFIRAGYRYEDHDGRANHVVRFSFGLNE